jgi:hypothetical protein
MKRSGIVLVLVALAVIVEWWLWPRLHSPSDQTAAYSATIELTGTPGAAFSGDYDRAGKRVAFSGVLFWTLTESNISRLEIRKAKMEDNLVLRARIGGSSISAPSGPDSKGMRLESEGGWRVEFIR